MVAVTGYLDVEGFRLRTMAPAQRVTEVENKVPGWLQTRLNARSSWINAQLAKRYATPFASPPPEIVCEWLTYLVTPELYAKLGFNPSAEDDKALILDPADRARDEIDEAADAENGKYELPLRQDTTATGVSKGGPFSSSQASPYAWMDVQRSRAVGEDSNG